LFILFQAEAAQKSTHDANTELMLCNIELQHPKRKKKLKEIFNIRDKLTNIHVSF